MTKILMPALCAQLMIVGLHLSAGTANAQYKANAAYWSILNTPVCWHPYSGTTLMLGWNSLTDQLPTAKPVGSGVQLGNGSLAGQCAVFGQYMCPGAPGTGNWIRGQQVAAGGVAPGTLIATFQTWNGQRWAYNGHTAIFAGYRADGALLVFDQNWIPFLVGNHAIDGNNRNDNQSVTNRWSYFVVE
jgi:hypothetical protein